MRILPLTLVPLGYAVDGRYDCTVRYLSGLVAGFSAFEKIALIMLGEAHLRVMSRGSALLHLVLHLV